MARRGSVRRRTVAARVRVACNTAWDAVSVVTLVAATQQWRTAPRADNCYRMPNLLVHVALRTGVPGNLRVRTPFDDEASIRVMVAVF